MAAYIIVNVTINDPSRYDEYKQLAAPTVEAYGGRYIVRGGETAALEGEWQPGRVVVLEFPDSDRAKEWWNSPEYAPAKEIRQAIATTDMIVVDGV
jgi:uncharacterized protein (DUF1330 family)